MTTRPIKEIAGAALATFALALAAAPAVAAGQADTATAAAPPATSRTASLVSTARRHVCDATAVIGRMAANTGMAAVLRQAQGLFVVPNYKRAALGVGARGGTGVLLVKQSGNWSDPALFTLGGISAGLQAGVEAGSLALVLNNQNAVERFRKTSNWSLNAEAGLTVVNWNAMAQGSSGRGDVVAWSDTKGLLGDVAIGITDIHFNQAQTNAYYGKAVTLADILAGSTHADAPEVAQLHQAASMASADTATGSSGTSGTSTAAGGPAASTACNK